MDKHAAYINNRLSLRDPLAESLELLAEIADILSMRKDCDLAAEEKKIKAHTAKLAKKNGTGGIFTEFERDFPCVCFALATGVGKTRLMGAFIAWLSRAKGMKNFLVLAPNLTIYNKLIEDFSNPRSSKYVFPGIGDFVHRPPAVITGDNYTSIGALSLLDASININIFNISKINAETKGGKQPRIKRLSEYLGDSYFNQLVNLDDLVILMDESHHYRAERGMQVINELKPVLGIELTATPKIETGGGRLFKNVVYQYGLRKAMDAGFVKEPFVATRMNMDTAKYLPEELDRLKLDDGIRVHEDTKIALELYARNENRPVVKPFVLIVTRDTGHAAEVKALIQSKAFCEGRYSDKVMEIHSNQRGEEKEENVQKLLTLESPDNSIEIVIHVNMLKEGWDVTNLYTIIPLRTSASETLTEQTIGRGLRLPYGGQRTGNDKVDKLTIIAHDNFERIIAEANKPDSIIRQKNIIDLDPDKFEGSKEIVVAKSTIAERIEAEEVKIEAMKASKAKDQAVISHEIRKMIHETIPLMNNVVMSVNDLHRKEIKAIVAAKVKEQALSSKQTALHKADLIKEIDAVYKATVDEFVQNIIEIPCISVQPLEEVDSGFKDFNLKVNELNFKPVEEKILVKSLENNSHQNLIDTNDTTADNMKLESVIVNELGKKQQIDYNSQAELLYKLTGQALAKLKKGKTEKDFFNVVNYHKGEIAEFIYSQMKPYFYCKPKAFKEPVVRPFTGIERHNLTKIKTDCIHPYTDTITPVSAITQKVFKGFEKACHSLYKFDSKPEKDFAAVLENDKKVLKWLRPAPRQFRIYWDHSASNYEPDFVVETDKVIFLVEVKRKDQMKSEEVKAKAKAALQYCKYASAHNLKNGGKEWKYLLLPDDDIKANMSLTFLADKHEVKR
jgi:type III restriction enzyme